MADDTDLDEEISQRRSLTGEHRLPPVLAVVVAGVSCALLPRILLFAPRLAIPVIEAVLLVAVLATRSNVQSPRTRWSRRATVVLAALPGSARHRIELVGSVDRRPDGAPASGTIEVVSTLGRGSTFHVELLALVAGAACRRHRGA